MNQREVTVESLHHLGGRAVREVAHLDVVKYIDGSSLGLIFIGILYLLVMKARTVSLVIDPPQLVNVVPIVVEPAGKEPRVAFSLGHLQLVGGADDVPGGARVELTDDDLG